VRIAMPAGRTRGCPTPDKLCRWGRFIVDEHWSPEQVVGRVHLGNAGSCIVSFAAIFRARLWRPGLSLHPTKRAGQVLSAQEGEAPTKKRGKIRSPRSS
jgi:hypothetical protein